MAMKAPHKNNWLVLLASMISLIACGMLWYMTSMIHTETVESDNVQFIFKQWSSTLLMLNHFMAYYTYIPHFFHKMKIFTSSSESVILWIFYPDKLWYVYHLMVSYSYNQEVFYHIFLLTSYDHRSNSVLILLKMSLFSYQAYTYWNLPIKWLWHIQLISMIISVLLCLAIWAVMAYMWYKMNKFFIWSLWSMFKLFKKIFKKQL